MTDLDPIHRLILSLIIHCSKDEDHARCIKSLEFTFTCTWSQLHLLFSHDRIWTRISAVCEAEVELKTVPTIACLTVYGPCSIIYICWLIQFKWPSSYGNTVVATTKPKDGRMLRTGIWLAVINFLGPIVPQALQNAFGKRLSATSNAGNLHRHRGWSVFVLQMRRQHAMLYFSSLFTKVRSYKLEGC